MSYEINAADFHMDTFSCSHRDFSNSLLELCGTWGRPCQPCWQSRVLVNTGTINLSLSEVPDFCEIRLFEYGPLKLRPTKVGVLEIRVT